ncbi:MAG: tRNA (adenosine(37)-N6)-threonylcarbamoyltransferase complex dimerization subunit type 1 TsaB [Gemmatimonas sp.]
MARSLRCQGVSLLPSPLLVVEASSSAGSVALIVDNAVVAERSVSMGASREDTVLPAIASVLAEARVSARDIRAVACGAGPGSFTSLRIAAAICKGIAVGNDAHLFAIPSFLLAASGLRSDPGRYLLHSDALRGERYVAELRILAGDTPMQLGERLRATRDELVTRADATGARLVAVGKSSDDIPDVAHVVPHARDAVLLTHEWAALGPVRVDTWEPEYGRLAEAQVKWEATHGRALSHD